MQIRLAEPADDRAVTALRRTWIEEFAGHPIDDAGFEDDCAVWFEAERDRGITWLAIEREEIVGMLDLMVANAMPVPGRPAGRWGYVSNLFVLVEHRGAGMGRKLLDVCAAYADSEGFTRLVLNPHEDAVGLYDRAGFSKDNNLMVRT